MTQADDLSRSLAAFDQNTTLTVVVETSAASWLVAAMLPGVDRHPVKKLEPDPDALWRLLERWRAEAAKTGRTIGRIALAYEAGRDGFWLVRWLRARDVEAHVIHSTSVAVSREHRRTKTDRLDAGMLMRVFLGWLRGERGHCGMVAIPTLDEEDAKRPSRERENLVAERTRISNRLKSALARLGIRGFKPLLRRAPRRLAALRTPEGLPIPPNMLAEMQRDMARLAVVRAQIEEIERARLQALQQAPERGPHAMVRLLARIVGVGIETADMLVQEVLSRNLRDRRAVARYAGLTGSPLKIIRSPCAVRTSCHLLRSEPPMIAVHYSCRQGFYGQAGVTWVTGTAPHFLHLIPHWPCRGICEDRLADPAKVGRLIGPLQRHAAESPRRKSEWK